MSNNNILFISTVGGWESCEELWSQAALDLARQGFDVSASVIETATVHPRIKLLERRRPGPAVTAYRDIPSGNGCFIMHFLRASRIGVRESRKAPT